MKSPTYIDEYVNVKQVSMCLSIEQRKLHELYKQ